MIFLPWVLSSRQIYSQTQQRRITNTRNFFSILSPTFFRLLHLEPSCIMLNRTCWNLLISRYISQAVSCSHEINWNELMLKLNIFDCPFYEITLSYINLWDLNEQINSVCDSIRWKTRKFEFQRMMARSMRRVTALNFLCIIPRFNKFLSR